MTLSAIGSEDVLINLRAMNKVEVDQANGTATLGAGTTTWELLKGAQDNGVHIGIPAHLLRLLNHQTDLINSGNCL